jgi:pseudouridine kinase
VNHDGREIIVVGGANVDIKARPESLMKAATSNPGRITITAGGVARNIAHNLALLGCRAVLITKLGNDIEGVRLAEETAAAGVDMSLTLRADEPTGSYCAVLDLEGELAIAVNSMSIIEEIAPADLMPHAHRLRLAQLIVADCNLSVETLDWLAGFAQDTGQKLLIEGVSVPKVAKLKEFLHNGRHIYAATPNLLQAQALTGVRIVKSSDAFEAAKKIAAMGVELVIITLGEQGVYVHSTEDSMLVPPFPTAGPVDVTGAGDAMTAGFVCGLSAGIGALAAAHVGQAASHITIMDERSVSPRLSREALIEMCAPRISMMFT